MKLPKTIEIDKYTYKIKKVKRLYNKKGHRLFGACSYKDQTIRIAQGQSKDEERDTLLHEIIHVASHVEGINLQEHQVEKLSSRLTQIFKHNKI